MSKQRLRGVMPEDTWKRIQRSEHTSGGSFHSDGAERWLAIRRVAHGRNTWEMSDAGVVDLHDGPFEDPDHGPNPLTMPMPDTEWDKVKDHTLDPDTGLLGSPGLSSYKVVAVINAPNAKAKAVKVE